MKELNNIIRREHRPDRVNFFEESPNTFKSITELSDVNVGRLTEGEPILDTANNRILIKSNGVLNKQVLDGADIKLEEV